MSIATMLNPADDFFDFDHDMLHRQMYTAAGPSSGSTIPYGIGTPTDADVPAGFFNTYHAQSHLDFAAAFPNLFWPSVVHINDVVGPNEDWALANRVLHNLALTVLR